MKAAIVTNFIPPYRTPLFAEVARLLDGELLVVSLEEMERNRDWAVERVTPFRSVVLPGVHGFFSSLDFGLHINSGLDRVLSEYQPDTILIGGWDNLAYWSAARYAKRHGLGLVLWSGSHELSSRFKGGLVGRVRRALLRMCDSYLTYGSMASKFLVNEGVSSERIVTGSNAIDVSAFLQPAGSRESIRRDLGASNRTVVLYVGQLIKRKGLKVLFESMRRLPAEVVLWIAGAGSDRRSLELEAESIGPERIRFLGSLPYRDLPSLYTAADMMIVPSNREVWGLVINEAMASALPVIASKAAGATADLIVGKKTGIVVDPDSANDIAEAVLRLHSDPALRIGMGRTGRKLISKLGIEEYARQMVAALQLAGTTTKTHK